ncbi:hypothetical protein I553_3524 [Mycobacterium xenopi 4042]|uniref:AAA domain protein n=1 Tax=Mycobacterium xenopi 4042 TaxID=1299334 RepID=X7ZYC0_MYCXE|nr:hypothetical protein I553_3524 [Mycobacterium xenopi 4042]
MLHRHAGHGEAVARITWCVDQRAIGVITGEVGAGKTVAVRAATANLDPSGTYSSTWPTPPSGCAACSPTSWPPSGTPRLPQIRPGPTGRRGAGQRTRRTRTQPRAGHRRSPPAG